MEFNFYTINGDIIYTRDEINKYIELSVYLGVFPYTHKLVYIKFDSSDQKKLNEINKSGNYYVLCVEGKPNDSEILINKYPNEIKNILRKSKTIFDYTIFEKNEAME